MTQARIYVAGHLGMVGSVMPTNRYGPGDNYHPQNGHVIPALIRRFHEAKQRWAHTLPMQGHINVGFGSDITIYQLAHAVGQAVGYTGNITFDATKPDGSPRKWMDSSRL